MRPTLVEIVKRELRRRKWSMAELDRRAGFSIGETRRFLSEERDLSSKKVESILDALKLTIRKRR